MKPLYLGYRGQALQKPPPPRQQNPRSRKSAKPVHPPMSKPMFWYQHDPLFVAKAREKSLGSKVNGRPLGLPTGYDLKTFKRYQKRAGQEARRIIKYMKAKSIFEADNHIAEEAVEEVLTILRNPASTKDKLAAAKTLLEYTQRKPVAASEMTLNNAESFLDSVLTDVKNDNKAKKAAKDDTGTDGSASETS